MDKTTTKKQKRARQNKLYRERHPEEMRARDKKYREEHKEKVYAQIRAWQNANKEHYLSNAKKLRLSYRLEALAHYGTRCNCCGETEPKFLSIDHINGYTGGPRSGDVLTNWLRKNNYPDGFQVLCHNCNFAKGKYGTCPHKTKG